MHVTLLNDTRQDRNPGSQVTASSLVCLLEDSRRTRVTVEEALADRDHALFVPHPARRARVGLFAASPHAAAITAQIGATGYAHKLLFDAGALDRVALCAHSA